MFKIIKRNFTIRITQGKLIMWVLLHLILMQTCAFLVGYELEYLRNLLSQWGEEGDPQRLTSEPQMMSESVFATCTYFCVIHPHPLAFQLNVLICNGNNYKSENSFFLSFRLHQSDTTGPISNFKFFKYKF